MHGLCILTGWWDTKNVKVVDFAPICSCTNHILSTQIALWQAFSRQWLQPYSPAFVPNACMVWPKMFSRSRWCTGALATALQVLCLLLGHEAEFLAS